MPIIVKKYKWLIGAFLLHVILHVAHMNKDLVGRHVWRQTQTQGTIENFATEDFNILNPREHRRNVYDGYYRMEFPLYQWSIAAIIKVTGNHIWVTRWFTQIIGFLSIIGMFLFLRTFLDEHIAQQGAWCFAWSPSLFYFSINPLPDNLALCLGIWGLYACFKFEQTNKIKHLIASAFLLAVSMAVKLPFGLLYTVPLFYFMLKVAKREWVKTLPYFSYLIPLSLPLFWYSWVIPTWDKEGILSGGHTNPQYLKNLWIYFAQNLWSVFPEVILNYGSVLFFLLGLLLVVKNHLYKKVEGQAILLLFLSLCAYFFYTLKMIKGHHEYYLFVFYPIVFSIVALGLQKMWSHSMQTKRLSLFLLFLLPVFTFLRSHNSWDVKNPSVPKELLNNKDWFRSLTPKEDLCIVGSDLSQYIYFYYLDKRGYAFGNDTILPEKMKYFVEKGSKYMYSDSRKVEELPHVKPYLDSLLFEKGNFRVFKLKSR